MKEIWKDITGYEGLYQVSSKGRVKSIGRITKTKNGAEFYVSEKIRKLSTTTAGYEYISLGKNGKAKTFLVHRLVAIEFIDNKDNLECINHKDEIKSNNSKENLEWCSYSYNNKYKNIHLRRNTSSTDRMIIQYDLDMIEIKRWESLALIIKELNIAGSNIIKCCKYERNHTAGFKWRYYE